MAARRRRSNGQSLLRRSCHRPGGLPGDVPTPPFNLDRKGVVRHQGQNRQSDHGGTPYPARHLTTPPSNGFSLGLAGGHQQFYTYTNRARSRAPDDVAPTMSTSILGGRPPAFTVQPPGEPGSTRVDRLRQHDNTLLSPSERNTPCSGHRGEADTSSCQRPSWPTDRLFRGLTARTHI